MNSKSILSKILPFALASTMMHSPQKTDIRNIDFTPKKAPNPKGLKKFIINGKEVWAINLKNAKRKGSKNDTNTIS